MSRNNLQKAGELVKKLQALSKQIRATPSRPGDEVVADQLSLFGELLVVLAAYMDRAQRTIMWLTWVIAALTAVLTFDAVIRIVGFHLGRG